MKGLAYIAIAGVCALTSSAAWCDVDLSPHYSFEEPLRYEVRYQSDSRMFVDGRPRHIQLMSVFAVFTVSKSEFDAATGETTFEIRTEQMRVTYGNDLHVNEFDSSIANGGDKIPMMFQMLQYQERMDAVLFVRVDESGEILEARADGVDADNAEDHVHVLYLHDVLSLSCEGCQIQLGGAWERPAPNPEETGHIAHRRYSFDAHDQPTASVSITFDHSWNPLDPRDELIEFDAISSARVEWDTKEGIAKSFSMDSRDNIAFWERRGREKSLRRFMSETTARISRMEHGE